MSTQTKAKTKLPLSFWACSTTEIFERFSYYLGRSLMLMFVAYSVAQGGLGLSDDVAVKMQSNLTAFSYALPILCAFVCDRLIGVRYTTPVGMVLCGIGYWIGSIANSSGMMYAMIWLVCIGLAFYKPSSIIGRILPKEDLDGAYTIRYALTNIGAFAGPFLAGILYQDVFADGEALGFRPCFKVAAILMWVGAVWFVLGGRFMGETGKKPWKQEMTEEERAREAEMKAKNKDAKNLPYSTQEKKRIGAIVLISVFAIVFWIFWYTTYMPIYYHWSEYANWNVGGYNVPLTWFDAFNALCCVLVGAFVIPKLWKRFKLSIYQQLALGIGSLGLAYLYFIVLDLARGDGQVSCLWMTIFALMITFAEMFFSPLGNSFIAKYAPSRVYTVMCGVWSLALFFGAKGYGYLYSGLFGGNFSFVTACIIIAAICAVVVVLLLVLDKPLSALVENKAEEKKAE